MKSLLLMSVVLLTLFAPVVAARGRNPVLAVRQLFFFFAGYCLIYVLYVSFIHTSFVPQRW